LGNIPSKNKVRSTPASSALALVLHQSYNVRLENCRLLHGSGERDGAQRRTKVSFRRIRMEALELLQLMNRNVSG